MPKNPPGFLVEAERASYSHSHSMRALLHHDNGERVFMTTTENATKTAQAQEKTQLEGKWGKKVIEAGYTSETGRAHV